MAAVAIGFSCQVQGVEYQTSMWFGTIRPPLAPPSGEVVDRIFIGDNFKGLTYADQDLLGLGTTPTLFYSIRHDAVSGKSFLDTIATPVAPHTLPPPVVDRFDIGNFAYNALAFAAPDLTYGPIIQYYLREDIGSPAFGVVNPNTGVHLDAFGLGNQIDSLTFSATDVSYGANLFYYLRRDLTGTHFGTIDPHLPGTLVDRSTLNLDHFDGLVFTDTDVGYGANQFYYLRHDPNSGQHYFGSINPLTGVAVDRFPVGTTADDFSELTFTATDLGYGPNLFYYLRSDFVVIPEPASLWPLAVLGSILGGCQWMRLRKRTAV